tara:strand:- start:4817 stop:7198 length:2382 start_codon:yes stop_codon:yes gene_type:complete
MGLKNLISNLETGKPFGGGYELSSTPEAYNYGQSISIFDTNIAPNKNDYFPFRQRSMGYGPKGVDIGGGSFFRGVSPEPFIKQKLPGLNEDQGSGTFDVIDDISDSFVRGGLITAGKRALIDVERIGKYLISGNGLAFIAKNVGMQAMNPKLQEGAGFMGRNRVYNLGVNTLAQVATSFTGLHVNRAGLFPIAKGNYRVEQGYRVDTNNDTKYEFNVRGGPAGTINGGGQGAGLLGLGGTGNVTNKTNVYKGNRLASLYNKLVNDNINPIGISSGGNPELYEFGGGPHSVYGIGKTRLKRYNFTNRDTFLALDLIKKDPTEGYQTSRHLGSIGGRKPGLLNDIIDFRKSKGKAHTDYQKRDPNTNKFVRDLLGMPKLVMHKNITGLQQSFNEGDVNTFPNIPTNKKGEIDITHGRKGEGDTTDRAGYQPTQFYWVGDKVNRMPIIRSTPTSYDSIANTEAHKGVKDYIKFAIEAVNADDPEETDTMVFRAFLESLDDDYAAKWNEHRYNGRAEPFYTYGNFKRSLSFSFKIAASSRADLRPIYTKLNYLVSQTAGDYKRTRLRGNWNRVTIGDYLDRVPGVFTSIKVKWSKEYPWEIMSNYKQKNDQGVFIDGDVRQLPHILDVSCQFQPVHDFIPRKSISNSPFIGPSRELENDTEMKDWYDSVYRYDDNNADKEVLRNDMDDKEELREEEAARQAEFEADMAEMEAMEEEERAQREEEDRQERLKKYEEEEEEARKQRVANGEEDEDGNPIFEEEDDDDDDWDSAPIDSGNLPPPGNEISVPGAGGGYTYP